MTDYDRAEAQAEWAREREMLAHYDQQFPAGIPLRERTRTYEDLGWMFDLLPRQVGYQINKHVRELREERDRQELRRLRNEPFESKAERLWMTLDWMASTIELRRGQA